MEQQIQAAREHRDALLEFANTRLHSSVIAVAQYYQSVPIHPRSDPVETSMLFGYLMAGEYFTGGINRDVKDGLLLHASGAARTLMEIVADMNHIANDRNDPPTRAQKYMDSLDTFKTEILRAAEAVENGVHTRLRNVNPWTTSSIDDRIGAFGAASQGVYDYLSYPAHGNPAVVTMIRSELLKSALAVTTAGCLVVMMLAMLKMAVNQGAGGITQDEIEVLNGEFESISGGVQHN